MQSARYNDIIIDVVAMRTVRFHSDRSEFAHSNSINSTHIIIIIIPVHDDIIIIRRVQVPTRRQLARHRSQADQTRFDRRIEVNVG